ncbi:MAG: type II toxin-antitoxin system VapC family toxin [Acidimicrobiaceae bacterium]|nr:type II toxin-antitoxin system VapC family toxin [Acidimicrobiaceae bacterium]
MRLLVDSHVALWWLDDHASLGTAARCQIAGADEAYFSVVTPWELGIKRALGKLAFPDGLVEALTAVGFAALPIGSAHAELAPRLPAHHRDPFDRMLVAQAQMESLVLVTADRSMDPYEVELLDARQ